MKVKPVHPNTKWPNNHTLYLSASGGGKSQMLNQNPEIPKKGARVILWDPSGDHPGLHFSSLSKFVQALGKAIKRGGGFRIAFGGNRTVENYERFCEIVWAVLDGRKKTYLICEELSAVCETTNKASANAAVLLNEGRKYGLEFHGTSQKPQEIAKTYYDQCERRYVGRQKNANIRKMALDIGVEPDQVRQLQNLQFFYDNGTADDPALVTIKYREIKGVKWL